MTKTKNFCAYLFMEPKMGTLLGTSLIFDTGYSDFGFFSYFAFRTSNFLKYLHPRIGRTYPGLPLEAVHLFKIKFHSRIYPSEFG